MPFTAVHGIRLGQCVLELPDAAGQDADLVMKYFGVREDETVSFTSGEGSVGADRRAALFDAAGARENTATSQLKPSTLSA